MTFRNDPDILAAALVGYEQRKKQIEQRMAELRRMIDGNPAPSTAPPEATPKRAKRVLSPEGRARIIAALRKRWAAARNSEGPQPGRTAAAAKTGGQTGRKPAAAKKGALASRGE